MEAASLRRRIGLTLGPLLAVALLATGPPGELAPEAWRTLAVALLMAVWWITEAIPIPATALLPIGLFPLLGVLPVQQATAPYANPVIFLFLGGFLIALAMERHGLHRRIALGIVRRVGGEPRALVAGFMAATALLSMWVSNTASTILMVSIATSVVALRPDADEGSFAPALVLSIAYAATIGGMATLVGTPPNALLAGFLSETYGHEIGFAQWMAAGLPVTLVMLPLTWLVLVRHFPRQGGDLGSGVQVAARSLGPASRGERATAVVFGATAGAWILRPWLENRIPGLSDAGIAILGGLSLFVIPTGGRTFVLDWSVAPRLPWGILLLFGGGLSLAGAIQQTGLAAWFGESLAGVGSLPLPLIVVIASGLLIFLTELTSNTATAATFLPILASLALGLGESPLVLVVPAALAVSCAFMMPVATPPNAIVFGTGLVTMPQMARVGLVLNLICLALIPLAAYALLGVVFGVQAGVIPEWAGP